MTYNVLQVSEYHVYTLFATYSQLIQFFVVFLKTQPISIEKDNFQKKGIISTISIASQTFVGKNDVISNLAIDKSRSFFHMFFWNARCDQ